MKRGSQYIEADVLERIRLGDVDAFKEFFHALHPEIFFFVYRYTGDWDVARDIAQDTFINFWRSHERIEPSLSAKSFLFRIARNLALNYLARTRHAFRLSIATEGVLMSPYLSIEEKHDDIFLHDDLQKAINSLPNRCREIFILSRFHDMSYSEIADTLGISLQTVKNQMNKAISVLRTRLSDYLD